MNVWQIDLKVYLLKNISHKGVMKKVTAFIDNTLEKDEYWKKYHKESRNKFYCYNLLYPIEKNGEYREGSIYTIQIRTVLEELKDYFIESLKDNVTIEMKGLVTKEQLLKQKYISKLISVTPVVIKTQKLYWRDELSIEEYLNLLRINLTKKYNEFYKTKLDENIEIFSGIRFKSKMPVSTKYKDISILGEKIELEIAKNEIAQKLAFFALGVGCGCMAARGFSYVNPRWV